MFEHLEEFSNVVVTGPQRSGTTIAGQMIAMDLGRKYVDEMRFGVRRLDRVKKILDGSEPVVIQAPALCRWVHLFARRPDTAVVMMRRDPADIIASQEAMDWTRRFEPNELAAYGVKAGPICKVKYAFWERHQRALLGEHAFEVEYESLRGHQLWVSEDLRQDFGPKQTRVA